MEGNESMQWIIDAVNEPYKGKEKFKEVDEAPVEACTGADGDDVEVPSDPVCARMEAETADNVFKPMGRETTDRYVSHVAKDFFEQLKFSLAVIGDEMEWRKVLSHISWQMRSAVDKFNKDGGLKGDARMKLTCNDNVHPALIAEALIASGDFRIIRWNECEENCLYAVRIYENGKPTGRWETFRCTEGALGKTMNKLIDMMAGQVSIRRKKEIIAAISSAFYNQRIPMAKDTFEDYDHKLVPCKNGIFDGRDYVFTGWTAADTINEKYPDVCFTWTLNVDYALPIVKPDYFDPDAFIRSLFPEGEVGDAANRLVWQIIQFSIREWCGTGHWMIFFVNGANTQKGANGKSTLISLIAHLFSDNPGDDPKINMTSLDRCMTGRFNLAPIAQEHIHLGTEMSATIEDTATFKKLIRGEPITVEEKGKPIYTIPGKDCMKIQAMNGYPRFRDKDEATMRKILAIPFDMDFSEDSGKCDERIGRVYIKDTAVLQYVLMRALQMDFADDYVAADRRMMDATKEEVINENFTSREALAEILPLMPETHIPVDVLYGFYTKYCKQNGITGSRVIARRRFSEDVQIYCQEHSDALKFDPKRKRFKQEILEEYNTNEQRRKGGATDGALVAYGGEQGQECPFVEYDQEVGPHGPMRPRYRLDVLNAMRPTGWVIRLKPMIDSDAD